MQRRSSAARPETSHTDAETTRRAAAAGVAGPGGSVEKAYLAYRSIPYEADAYEVGDSESEVFSKLPLVRLVPVADLTATFGRYETQERSEPGMPWPLMFHDAVQGGAARVSLLVEVAGPLAEIDRHDASVVTLRIGPVP